MAIASHNGTVVDYGGGTGGKMANAVLLVDQSGNPIVTANGQMAVDIIRLGGQALAAGTNGVLPADLRVQGGSAGAGGDRTLKSFSWSSDGQTTTGDALLVKAILFGNTGSVALNMSDGDGASGARVPMIGALNWNGTTGDRQYNNTQGTLLASAARTASTLTPDQTNYNARGVIIHLNVTANPGAAETLALSMLVKDPVSGTYSLFASSGTVITAANGARTFIVYPGAIAADGVATIAFPKGLPVPRTWIAQVTHSASGSWTYSLGYQYIV